MPGTLFDYEPGYVTARFRQDPRHDRIWLELDMTGHVVTTTACDDNGERSDPVDQPAGNAKGAIYMDSEFCPFPELVRFLSAICTDVRECGFHWDAEGPWGEMKWTRGPLHARHGFLEINWYSDKDPFSHRVMVRTHQAVGMLYAAFRGFAESPHYEPFRYEEITLARAAELLIRDASFETFVACLVEMDREGAEAALRALGSAAFVRERDAGSAPLSLAHCLRGEPLTAVDVQANQDLLELLYGDAAPETTSTDFGVLRPEWDAWGTEARLSELKRRLASVRLGTGGAGSDLRALRSRLVEDWLRESR